MILSLVGMILSNSSAKEKSRRFKATKRSKGNSNGGQGQTAVPDPQPPLPPLVCMEAPPKIGQVLRIWSREPGWESRRCFCEWRDTPPSSRLSLAGGHTAQGSAPPVWGTQTAQPVAVTLARRQNVKFTQRLALEK